MALGTLSFLLLLSSAWLRPTGGVRQQTAASLGWRKVKLDPPIGYNESSPTNLFRARFMLKFQLDDPTLQSQFLQRCKFGFESFQDQIRELLNARTAKVLVDDCDQGKSNPKELSFDVRLIMPVDAMRDYKDPLAPKTDAAGKPVRGAVEHLSVEGVLPKLVLDAALNHRMLAKAIQEMQTSQKQTLPARRNEQIGETNWDTVHIPIITIHRESSNVEMSSAGVKWYNQFANETWWTYASYKFKEVWSHAFALPVIWYESPTYNRIGEETFLTGVIDKILGISGKIRKNSPVKIIDIANKPSSQQGFFEQEITFKVRLPVEVMLTEYDIAMIFRRHFSNFVDNLPITWRATAQKIVRFWHMKPGQTSNEVPMPEQVQSNEYPYEIEFRGDMTSADKMISDANIMKEMIANSLDTSARFISLTNKLEVRKLDVDNEMLLVNIVFKLNEKETEDGRKRYDSIFRANAKTEFNLKIKEYNMMVEQENAKKKNKDKQLEHIRVQFVRFHDVDEKEQIRTQNTKIVHVVFNQKIPTILVDKKFWTESMKETFNMDIDITEMNEVHTQILDITYFEKNVHEFTKVDSTKDLTNLNTKLAPYGEQLKILLVTAQAISKESRYIWFVFNKKIEKMPDNSALQEKMVNHGIIVQSTKLVHEGMVTRIKYLRCGEIEKKEKWDTILAETKIGVQEFGYNFEYFTTKELAGIIRAKPCGVNRLSSRGSERT